MKRRLQLISNSSSSSYIIYGDNVMPCDRESLEDILLLIHDEDNDEYDYVILTEEIKEFIKNNRHNIFTEVFRGIYLKDSYWYDPELEGYSKQEKPKDKFFVECAIKNDSTNKDLEIFKERYYENS